ncbi:MAG: FAD-dependent monooxygenase [Lapillicoccus sp.]
MLFSIDEERFWGSVGPSVCVRRGDLVDILLTTPPALQPRWSTAVTGVSVEAGAVEVLTESGAFDAYDFVVGADGVHSQVRAAVSESVVERSVMTGSSWRFMTANPGVACWTAWSGASGTLLLIPVDGSSAYGYASATRGGVVAEDPRALVTAFSDFAEPVPTVIRFVVAEGTDLYYSPVEEVTSAQWSHGRAVLVGDAAHAMGPVWAQGAALALVDGIVLAELLAGSTSWDAVGTATRRDAGRG